MLELKDIVLDSHREGLLQPFSLMAHEGDVSVIRGQQGCGKTWFMRLMMGFATAESGYVTIDGEVVSTLSAPFFRQRMAYLPQDLTMPQLKVSELLGRLWMLRGNSQEEFRHANVRRQWQQLALDSSLWDARADELQPQVLRRIFLSAIALLHRPIVLLDMPLLGQTADEASLIEAYIRQMAGEGRIVVMTDY